MKFAIVQPFYSINYKDADKCFESLMNILDSINEDFDAIVLPEYSDVPAYPKNRQEFVDEINKYHPLLGKKVKEIIKKHNAIVFVNCVDYIDGNYRNTTFTYNKSGNIVGKYYKRHLAPSEYKSVEDGGKNIDYSYKTTDFKPYVLEIDGIKYGFLTCYDFYFYEDYIEIAKENVDCIIGCSHQRSDSHESLSIINKFLSYNTNSYLIRSSVSMGEESKTGGCSMVVNPKGEIIANMYNRVGYMIVDINPKNKYYKTAGFMGKVKSHHEYVDEGREYLKK